VEAGLREIIQDVFANGGIARSRSFAPLTPSALTRARGPIRAGAQDDTVVVKPREEDDRTPPNSRVRSSVYALAKALDGEAGLKAAGGGYAPGHGGGVVSEAEAAVGAEEDDAAVSAEAVVEVRDGLAGGDFWS